MLRRAKAPRQHGRESGAARRNQSPSSCRQLGLQLSQLLFFVVFLLPASCVCARRRHINRISLNLYLEIHRQAAALTLPALRQGRRGHTPRRGMHRRALGAHEPVVELFLLELLELVLELLLWWHVHKSAW